MTQPKKTTLVSETACPDCGRKMETRIFDDMGDVNHWCGCRLCGIAGIGVDWAEAVEMMMFFREQERNQGADEDDDF